LALSSKFLVHLAHNKCLKLFGFVWLCFFRELGIRQPNPRNRKSYYRRRAGQEMNLEFSSQVSQLHASHFFKPLVLWKIPASFVNAPGSAFRAIRRSALAGHGLSIPTHA
jgi:hypothetical protein